MLGRALLTLLFVTGVFVPVEADQARVSDWLVEGRKELVDTVAAARLAMLCQQWSLKLDKAGFLRVMQDRTGLLPPADQGFVAQVIRDGEAQASDDHRMAALSACLSLVPTQLVRAAAYINGQTGLRGLVRLR